MFLVRRYEERELEIRFGASRTACRALELATLSMASASTAREETSGAGLEEEM